ARLPCLPIVAAIPRWFGPTLADAAGLVAVQREPAFARQDPALGMRRRAGRPGQETQLAHAPVHDGVLGDVPALDAGESHHPEGVREHGEGRLWAVTLAVCFGRADHADLGDAVDRVQ